MYTNDDTEKGVTMKAPSALHRIQALVLPLLLLSALLPPTAFAQNAGDPEYNFDYLWKTFDANYATFTAKHIDWKALYNVYRPRVTATTSDDELFEIVSAMLGHLNDNHVQLISRDPQRQFSAGYLMEMFGSDGIAKFVQILRHRPVPETCFKSPLTETGNGVFAYGRLDDRIGYIHFNAFANRDASAKAMDEIMAAFKDAEAVVVDIRRNGGGDDQVGKLIAGRFADRKRLYMTTQERNGSGYEDFDAKKRFFVEPSGPIQFTKTVILLTNRLSVSAAENFTLAMRILPHVTVVGDFTSGCFADMQRFTLPNGWMASYAKNLFLDQNGFCWEGIGVPPDIKVICDYVTIAPEKDPVLELAIELIRKGNLSLQDESANMRPTESLAALLEKDMNDIGIEPALAAFRERKENDSAGVYYADYYELLGLARQQLAAGQFDAGEKVLSLMSDLFPNMTTVNDMLGLAYLKQNRKADARRVLEKAAAAKKERYTPESRQFAEYLNDALIVDYISDGIGGLDRRYGLLQKTYPNQVNEDLLNGLGYFLMNSGLSGAAVDVFTLMVKRFPESYNAWDSLGEGYMNAGDRKKAIANFKKSLELNPDNANATAMLKQLQSEL